MSNITTSRKQMLKQALTMLEAVEWLPQDEELSQDEQELLTKIMSVCMRIPAGYEDLVEHDTPFNQN